MSTCLWQDVRFAVRGFRANPNVTLPVVLSLALGIGATCAIFSVIYGVVIDLIFLKKRAGLIGPFPKLDRPAFQCKSCDAGSFIPNCSVHQSHVSELFC
jgi:hypothetical protein